MGQRRSICKAGKRPDVRRGPKKNEYGVSWRRAASARSWWRSTRSRGAEARLALSQRITAELDIHGFGHG